MTTIYQYLSANKTKMVFANRADIRDTLRVGMSGFTPKDKDLPYIQQDSIVRNLPFLVSDPDCAPCDKKYATISVGLDISGPIAAKAIKKQLVAELAALIASGGFDAQFDGFSANPTTQYSIELIIGE